MIGDDSGQNEDIDEEKQEAGQPQQEESVPTLKLQTIGQIQPDTLQINVFSVCVCERECVCVQCGIYFRDRPAQ